MTQREALDILKTGVNVFLTGAAGSGKTHVLREYISYLREHDVRVGITASTGIAATHMGGMTIHSWAGIGIDTELSRGDLEVLAEQPRLRKRFLETEVLIIDEISMLDHKRLDLVNKVLKSLRANEAPFGGLQVVCCGDFFQLPPISRDGDEAKFAYHAQAWQEAEFTTCYLHEQHRQSDRTYYDVLNAIRASEVDESTHAVLQSRHNKKPAGSAEPTRLYSHNVNVDEENERELAKLPGREYSYTMETKGGRALVAALQKSCLAPETLKLKVDARVMFVKNLNEIGCSNGTLGIVTACDAYSITVKTSSGKIVSVEPEPWRVEEDGKVKAELKQYPLRLAWAITVHKSQGMSLDAAIVDLRRSFAPGMGYVALSRVRSLDGLCLLGINANALTVHPEVLERDRQFRADSDAAAAALHSQRSKDITDTQESFLARVRGTPSTKKKSSGAASTVAQTRELFVARYSPQEIARARGLTLGTVLEHLEQLKKHDPALDFSHVADSVQAATYEKIASLFREIGPNEKGVYPLAPVYTELGGGYEYETLRMVRLTL